MSVSDQHNGSISPPPDEEEISLLDLILVLVRRRWMITHVILGFLSLSLLYAVVASSEYTADSRVIREVESKSASGLPSGGLAALRGLGISLGGMTEGLSAEAYPEILQSREVRLAVARDTFGFPNYEERMTYVERIDQPPGILGLLRRYTIGLPGVIAGEEDSLQTGQGPSGPSRLEMKAAQAVGNLVSASIDDETGLMRVQAVTSSPTLSSEIAWSFLSHLRDRVRTIRTEKARQNLSFIEERFQEVKDELRVAEERLANFVDRNQNLNSAELRTERDRLQRQVRFKSELFSELQTQQTQSRIELQRSAPVITIVEEPVPPVKPSGPNRTLIVFVGLFVGALIAVGTAFIQAFLLSPGEEAEEQEKIEEIREAFAPVMRWAGRFGNENPLRTEDSAD